jgi:cytochrome c556
MTRLAGRDAHLRPIASRFGVGAALIAACLIAPMYAAVSQAQSIPPPKDAIFARKILMGAIDMNMDEIETMLAPEGKLDLAEGREHANTISIMLMAFPHMFAAATNQWTAGANRDPATDTLASPDVWADLPDFYQRATDASKFALDAVRAKRSDDFRPAIAQLRAACNACHAVYMKSD